MKPQSILITGCSSGIGLCVARGLQQRGHRVIASCRKPEDVQRLREQEGLDCIQLDLDDSDSIALAVGQTLERTGGGLDALFNNGAYGLPGAVEDLSRDALRAQFETNVFGWQELTNLVLPVMRRQGHGRIIQNSSVLGFVALSYRGAYVASKFAIEGLADTLRLELQGSGISISLIEPGPIESRFRDNAQRAFQRWIQREGSAHARAYDAMEARLRKQEPTLFTLPPEAVLDKVIHALESPRPRARYPVTLPTWVFAYLKRLLSTRLMDRILSAVSGNGTR